MISMKKSILLLLALALWTLNGCGGVKGLMTYSTDPSLQGVGKVHALPTMNAVGFEWEKIDNQKIRGVNVYRGNANGDAESFKRISTVGNRYATHFVDRHVKANTAYSYTFSTFALGKESSRSKTVFVETLPEFSAVAFVKAYQVAPSVVKLLWKPHSNPSINAYIVERSVNDGAWKFVSQVEGRLMAEYIDTFVRQGKEYRYRIIAQSYDKIKAKPSHTTQITL